MDVACQAEIQEFVKEQCEEGPWDGQYIVYKIHVERLNVPEKF